MAGRHGLPAGQQKLKYEVVWQVQGTVTAKPHGGLRQQNSFWRWTHAGRGQTCPALLPGDAASASAVFQACQRGLRILQTHCTPPGAVPAVSVWSRNQL